LSPYGEEGSSEEEEFVKYTSGESEMFSTNDENDLELIEQAMKCAYMSSRSTVQRVGMGNYSIITIIVIIILAIIDIVYFSLT